MRKEINLDKEVIKKLKKLAKADRRLLKPYMEKILIEHATHGNKNKDRT